jgi:integrase/recombinase XerD
VDFIGGSKARLLPKTLTRDEAAKLMAMPNLAAPTGLRDRCVMMLMHRCGLRVSEVCGLLLRDVKWADHQIHVRPENAKGGREAYVYLDDETFSMLERWKTARRAYGANKPHLFVCVRTADRGEPLTRRAIHKMVARRSAKAGIDHPVWPHMLRHSYATDLLNEGFNIAEVQKLMRHSNVQTTSIYLHVRDNELQAKIRARSSNPGQ